MKTYNTINTLNKKAVTLITVMLITCSFFIVSCKKNGLDIVPDKSLVVPGNLQDFQGLLDNVSQLNINSPYLGEVSSNDFYLSFANWQSARTEDRNAYVWAKDIFEGLSVADWNSTYKKIFYANVILEGLAKITPGNNQSEWNNIKGQALFTRALALYQVAQLFAKPYRQATSSTDPGIPLRLTSDINETSVRATVQESYEQIIKDLKEAVGLMPLTPLYKTRASNPAAYGLLARVYQSMELYDEALFYADACLKEYSTLLDYNSLNAANTYTMTIFNNEVIFHATIANLAIFSLARLSVYPAMYQSYAANDLRKTMFFRDNGNGTFAYRGSYYGNVLLFSGIASDELFLIRAECYARKGDANLAMKDLNALLVKRWKTGTYVTLTAIDAEDALKKILDERHKELVFRGLRWNDLRRLNNDARFAVTLSRDLNGQVYTLPPNDPRYVFAIPDNVVRLTGMEQNPR